MKSNRFWISIIILILGFWCFNHHELDSEYNRPIRGDAKGYYAFLPAIFIYQDLSYDFVDEMEMKYYPQDGSFAKAFRMKQPNGTVVNKCFPGTSIFYLPFFLLALLFSWMVGIPVDGYSILFQWSIAAAHLFYLFWGLLLLGKSLKINGVANHRIVISLVLVVFATNVFYYSVYDFSVPHIFGFFGSCTMIYLVTKYKQSYRWKFIGWTIPLLALLVLTRPTNGMLIIVFPLILSWKELKLVLQPANLVTRQTLLYSVFGLSVVALAPILWKAQSGNWLVYSYGNEKIDLLQPHFWEFLFSYRQGWWFWTPFMLLAFIFGIIYFFKTDKLKALVFTVGVVVTVYIFSSWWIWTFGLSYGQRPMIEFYPLLIVGFAGFLELKQWKWLHVIFIPFIALNLIQAYQVKMDILKGGRTTKEMYWSHFLQLKKDPLIAQKEANWVEMERKSIKNKLILTKTTNFTNAIVFDEIQKGDKLIFKSKIGAAFDQSNTIVIVSDTTGVLYLSKYIKNELYANIREMSFLFEIEQEVSTPIKCYIWNPDSEVEVTVESIEVIHYRPKSK